MDKHQQMNNTEQERINIVGLVVNTLFDQQQSVLSILKTTKGVEICGTKKGKLVLTIDEMGCNQALVDTITQINNISGVVATSIAYHHFEEGSAIEEKQL